MKQPPEVKATLGSGKTIIVADCPFCHGRHEHQLPIMMGYRSAGCLKGEYMLTFNGLRIETYARSRDYMACIADHDEQWESGRTEIEAIEKLIASRGE